MQTISYATVAELALITFHYAEIRGADRPAGDFATQDAAAQAMADESKKYGSGATRTIIGATLTNGVNMIGQAVTVRMYWTKRPSAQ